MDAGILKSKQIKRRKILEEKKWNWLCLCGGIICNFPLFLPLLYNVFALFYDENTLRKTKWAELWGILKYFWTVELFAGNWNIWWKLFSSIIAVFLTLSHMAENITIIFLKTNNTHSPLPQQVLVLEELFIDLVTHEICFETILVS